MNTSSRNLIAGPRGALCMTLVALAAGAPGLADEAANPERTALTTPANTVDVGVGNVSDRSFKFGEYNGLQREGGYLDLGFDLRGGGAWDSNSAWRWRIRASDLGLDTRSLVAEFGKQGTFRLTVGYDELRRNSPTGDSYQTPYLGLGTGNLTLPAGWLKPLVPRLSGSAPNARGLLDSVTASDVLVNGVVRTPNDAQLATAAAIQAADLAAFRPWEVYTTRKRFDAGLSAVARKNWDFSVNARREDRNGTKVMGSVTRATDGSFNASDLGTLLPDPIDQRTDQLTAQASYHNSHRDFLQASYTASVFKNDVTGLTWQSWALPTSTQTLSSAPDNKSSQFNLAGGHDFGARTRLTGSASYSRNTQDARYLVDVIAPLVPASSLDGVVKTTNYGLRLTTRPVNALTLNLGYRYDNRDNQTRIRTYGWYDAGDERSGTPLDANFAAALGVLPSALDNNVNINASRPYSRKSTEYTLDADYRFSAREVLHAGFGRQQIDRWCNGSWYNCMDAAQTRENTFNVELRSTLGEAVHTRIGYTRANRTVDAYNENAFLALVPMANVTPSNATTSAYQFMLANGWNGYGPSLGFEATTGDMNVFFPRNNALANASYQNGNRISELLGMRRYNMANRQRDRVKGELDWHASERWALQGNADWRRDDYNDSRYGLVGESDFAAEFTAAENLNLVAFYTHERLSRDDDGNTYTANSNATAVNGFTDIANGCFAKIAERNASNKIDPCLDWAARTSTRSDVYGFTIDRKELLPSRRLDLKLEALVSDSTSANNVLGGNYANNPLAVTGAPAGTIAAYYIPATALPDVVSRSWEVRLVGKYHLNKASSIRVGYLHAYYLSRDYAYDGLQLGGLAGVLPTLQVAPSYAIDVVTVGYAARF